MLAPLDNGVVFKAAFTDKIVFQSFVKDIVGIEIVVDKIETEKKFTPKIGNVDFSLDIFAESVDKRVIIEIQRIDYDYNFDRFLHYFMMAITQMQTGANEYKIDRTVYSIVVLTAPYKMKEKSGIAVRDEVLITSLDPRNLEDKVVNLYGHKLIFLNPCYRNENTPANYRDWLDLVYESIHNPKSFNVNMENQGIRRAVELIEYEHLTPKQNRLLKIDTQKKVVTQIVREEGKEEGRAEGREEATTEIAINLLKQGIPIEAIALATNMSKEEIEKIAGDQ